MFILKTTQFQFGFSALTMKLCLIFICRKTHSYEVWIKLRNSNFACGEWNVWAKSSLSLSPCTHPPSQSGGLSVLPSASNLAIQQGFGKSKMEDPIKHKKAQSSEARASPLLARHPLSCSGQPPSKAWKKWHSDPIVLFRYLPLSDQSLAISGPWRFKQNT